jgi:transposase-like protein
MCTIGRSIAYLFPTIQGMGGRRLCSWGSMCGRLSLQTDFFFTEHGDEHAAKTFLTQAMRRHGSVTRRVVLSMAAARCRV